MIMPSLKDRIIEAQKQKQGIPVNRQPRRTYQEPLIETRTQYVPVPVKPRQPQGQLPPKREMSMRRLIEFDPVNKPRKR
jgi:hypothetical protein